MEHLTLLNTQLQGREQLINGLFRFVSAFETKLRLWETQLRDANYEHFPTLMENELATLDTFSTTAQLKSVQNISGSELDTAESTKSKDSEVIDTDTDSKNALPLADEIPNGSQAVLGNVATKMRIVYTCKVCNTRSSKTFSKLAYTKGIVIVKCPGCDSRHLIADNIGWFKHVEHKNVEEILASKGEQVQRTFDDEDTLQVTLEEPNDTVKPQSGS
ncbi:hypothetical protein LSAT2_025919 [Lamellibrachia satsuma]|nr:hypothetical protein LSAT2_025919 [Lamellibrachia satsuma]